MRSELSRYGFWFEHTRPGPRGSWRVAVAALVALAGCAGVLPAKQEPFDLTPLIEAQTDPSIGLSAAFPDYDAVVVGGVNMADGRDAQDGVVDLVTETYDSELDPAQSWLVDVSVTRFDTPARAAREIDASCSSFSRGGASGHPVRWRDGVYCISSVVHQRNDPHNMYLPANFYASWLFVRSDRIVVRMYERQRRSAKSAKGEIIAEIADRLSNEMATPAAE